MTGYDQEPDGWRCATCGYFYPNRGDLAFKPPAECENCEEQEPPCECVQIDADEWSARNCPAHGPNSPAEKRWKAVEAEDEARSAARIPILLGEDPATW